MRQVKTVIGVISAALVVAVSPVAAHGGAPPADPTPTPVSIALATAGGGANVVSEVDIPQVSDDGSVRLVLSPLPLTADTPAGPNDGSGPNRSYLDVAGTLVLLPSDPDNGLCDNCYLGINRDGTSIYSYAFGYEPNGGQVMTVLHRSATTVTIDWQVVLPASARLVSWSSAMVVSVTGDCLGPANTAVASQTLVVDYATGQRSELTLPAGECVESGRIHDDPTHAFVTTALYAPPGTPNWVPAISSRRLLHVDVATPTIGAAVVTDIEPDLSAFTTGAVDVALASPQPNTGADGDIAVITATFRLGDQYCWIDGLLDLATSAVELAPITFRCSPVPRSQSSDQTVLIGATLGGNPIALDIDCGGNCPRLGYFVTDSLGEARDDALTDQLPDPPGIWALRVNEGAVGSKVLVQRLDIGAPPGSMITWELFDIASGTSTPLTYLAVPEPGSIDTVGVFRPSNGVIYLKNTNTAGFADIETLYGQGGDVAIAGDWDGDGTDGFGIYRNGVFYLRNATSPGFADVILPFGIPTDLPVAGDWDGDGDDTPGVYRDGIFHIIDSVTAPVVTSFSLGTVGDTPIAGDWDGDGRDGPGVFRPSNGLIYLKQEATSGFADIETIFGQAGDLPVAGDWDGDGDDTFGIYRDGSFYLRNETSPGFADFVFPLGVAGDTPLAGDWDGA